jgi:gliding motility-associated-like protein
MNGMKNILILVLYCCSAVATAQITVDDTKTPQQLVENVLVNSTCATVLNSTAKGNNAVPLQNSFASFNANGSNFPFAQGVVLSTSASKNAIGPYVSGFSGGDLNWLGDSDLDQTLGINSINATVLEFDFVPLTNFISFNYIFASNEYQSNYPCAYSDGFAFLIKENGSIDPYKNIAVLPDSNIPIPVSSKNVHPIINTTVDVNNITHPGCPAINESYFNGYNTNTSPVNYSGQTIKLNAKTAVIPGRNYHIKLVIADARDPQYDSAVFLEAGSFSPKIDLGPDRSSTTNNPLCFGESFTIETKLPASYTYEWFKDGSKLNGESNPKLTITDAGIYKVKIAFSPTCTAEEQIKIEYTPKIILSNSILAQCDDDGDGISTFDLTKADPIIKNNNPTLVKVVYFTSFAEAQTGSNPIANPSSYHNTVPNQVLHAKVTSTSGCSEYVTLQLIISNNAIATQNPIEACDLDAKQDGLTQFNLNTQITPQVISGLTAGLTVEYYLNETDAIAQKNQLPNLFTNTIPNQQIIYARIVNGADCFRITPETLVIHTFDPLDFQDETFILCNGANINLTVATGFSSYLWSNGATTNTINSTIAGVFTVTVSNTNGCKKTKKFTIKASGIGTIQNATITDFSGTQNTVLFSYSGDGDYEFSLDNNFYQDNPLFTGVHAGIYYAIARDKNGCGVSAPYPLYVLDYPRFFTPNNDGRNDTWEIKNLNLLPKSTIAIVDRYGKLLKQLDSNSSGWNGIYNEKELPADDYWFILTFEDGKIIRGHFSLKR